MSTMIRPTSPASVQPGRLLGARQLADVVQRLAANPADWIARVRLNPAGRWYERIHLDDSHEVWVISWLPGQATGFHDHGGSAGPDLSAPVDGEVGRLLHAPGLVSHAGVA